MIHPLIYEINTRCWLRRLSDRQGRAVTLANVPEAELDHWQALGFTHIWTMGVWTTGPRSRAHALENVQLQNQFNKILPGWTKHDVAGSPYAIGDYKVPELLGGEEGLKQFRERLNKRGMKLLLDFVPNHLGLDHPWLAERPELFVQSPVETPGTFQQSTQDGLRWLAHGKDPYFHPWTDTVQLNYQRAETRTAMIELLQSVSGRCDGVRCDMAMLLLNEVFAKTWAGFPETEPMPAEEFWADAIHAVRRHHPDFIFLAEVYWGLETKLQELGFDYTYAKTVYDRLVEQHHAELQNQLLSSAPKHLVSSAHFLENHDERRAASVFRGIQEHQAAALLMLGLPGMRLLYEGQAQGARLQVPVHLARWPDEPADAEISAMYDRFLTALKTSAVGRGEFHLLKPENVLENSAAQNFVVIQWQKVPEEFELVVVNLAAQCGSCHLKPIVADLASHPWRMRDLLGPQVQQFQGGELAGQGLHLELPAHGAQLFHFSQS